MNRYRWILTFFIFLLNSEFPSGKQLQQNYSYFHLYRFAEQLYHDKNQTDEKDSLALRTYLKVIRLLENHHINDSILWDSYYKAAIYYQTNGDYEKAAPLLKRNINLSDYL